jgi:hypothetical protein
LDGQPGDALDATGFLRFGDASADDLTPLRYHNAISYQRSRQSRREPVADLILVRR